ncbi:MAG TPA: hypothetical protein VJY41_02400 [Prolixibacteraceae bacterium]|nr:hypothetical protein [Prolixibacteraceae bacterium]
MILLSYRYAAGQPWQDSSTVNYTDWQNEVFHQAKVNNVQVSFLNGTEKLNSAIIGSYFKQEGIIKGSDYERYTMRVNTSSKIKPWLNWRKHWNQPFNPKHPTRTERMELGSNPNAGYGPIGF